MRELGACNRLEHMSLKDCNGHGASSRRQGQLGGQLEVAVGEFEDMLRAGLCLVQLEIG